MFTKANFFKAIIFFFLRILFRQFRNHPKGLHRSFSNNVHATTTQTKKYQKFPSLAHGSDISSKTLIFNVEGTLLRSSSLFPYFMLVAFEAGSIFRAMLLFLAYPFVCLVNEEMCLKVMIFVCFFGIKKNSFRLGRAVLPKFFLEDVGLEAFEVLKRGGRKVAVSDNFPRVMIENFLEDYLEIDCVVARELKTVFGFFVGVMEAKKIVVEKVLGEKKTSRNCDVIGICQFNKSLDLQLFSLCKEIYLVRDGYKKGWQRLPREEYPKPLIFHDGRLAFKPTLLNTLVLFMWIPFGIVLALTRAFAAITLPYKIAIPIFSLLGIRAVLSGPNYNSSSSPKGKKGLLYVCNHRTLLDPLYLAFALKRDFIAVTYSLSRISEILSPIKTVRLTRDRIQDANMMEKLLSQGDLVICPEGTTCREPYLLRFSPLFSELGDHIVPVALNTHVSMFYGTTAGGLKCLDPLFFLMNPHPTYTINFLEDVSGLSKCQDGDNQRSRFDVANHVQSEISKALGFECTTLTRRDKYLILAGNEGIAKSPKSMQQSPHHLITCKVEINEEH